MVENIRRKPINEKSLNSESLGTDDEGHFSDVSLNCFDPPEEAGWSAKCLEQRNLLDAVLGKRMDQIRQVVDHSM
eukprot:CAMPEP_0170457864 /NCGR_PEP_ID=MMETSP0123-20130129/5007_1 /TAXON_ID=182087 /ORGANISM="Favella ehrenbergii, Strain Fehren 1" /LENGTH=74 /DNA_ID=CAMNT_0010721785 /DNA_START=37 /DNA_END=261 /DNA_ORIENTATION=+